MEPNRLAKSPHCLEAEKRVALHSPAALVTEQAAENVSDGIGSHGRHAAPVVDASVEQLIIIRRREIRWRLDVDLRHEQARHGHTPKHFVTAKLGPVVHWDSWLSPEVLHDNFLNVPIAAVQIANRQ